jgi:hypothetical protein
VSTPAVIPKVSASYLLGCAAGGVILFWVIGVWLLPDRQLVLKNFRGYMAIGFMLTLVGAYVYERGSGIVKNAGKSLLGAGFGCIGAFFALCFYLVISLTFLK